MCVYINATACEGAMVSVKFGLRAICDFLIEVCMGEFFGLCCLVLEFAVPARRHLAGRGLEFQLLRARDLDFQP